MDFKTLDFILLAFLVLFFFLGYRKGFFRSVLSFFSLLVVSLVAPNVSSGVSKNIYKSFVEEKVQCVTEKVFEGTSEKISKRQLNRALRGLDPFSSNILKFAGAFDFETFVSNKNSKEAVNNVIRERSLKYIDFLLNLIVSLVLMIIFRVLLKRISLRNLPVIGGVDAVLGGTLGFLECVVLVFVFFYMFNLFDPFFGESKSDFVLYNSIKESLAFRFFKEFNFWSFVK